MESKRSNHIFRGWEDGRLPVFTLRSRGDKGLLHNVIDHAAPRSVWGGAEYFSENRTRVTWIELSWVFTSQLYFGTSGLGLITNSWRELWYLFGFFIFKFYLLILLVRFCCCIFDYNTCAWQFRVPQKKSFFDEPVKTGAGLRSFKKQHDGGFAKEVSVM